MSTLLRAFLCDLPFYSGQKFRPRYIIRYFWPISMNNSSLRPSTSISELPSHLNHSHSQHPAHNLAENNINNEFNSGRLSDDQDSYAMNSSCSKKDYATTANDGPGPKDIAVDFYPIISLQRTEESNGAYAERIGRLWFNLTKDQQELYQFKINRELKSMRSHFAAHLSKALKRQSIRTVPLALIGGRRNELDRRHQPNNETPMKLGIQLSPSKPVRLLKANPKLMRLRRFIRKSNQYKRNGNKRCRYIDPKLNWKI